MGCGGEREKGPPEVTARWEFINLDDFKSSSPLTYMAYGWLWFMALVAVAVYAVDTFTAINLVAFNNWSSQVKPYVPFEYSKWIFSGCILLSWILAIYEWVRAYRVIQRGGVAESYMDPLAVTLLSMKPKGWRRFLVFKALTSSKKRIDYCALSVYFAFKGSIRVILAEGPRQVVNALTLYSVTQANLIVKGTPTNKASGIDQFWLNLKALADENDRQTIILSSMAFTLLIWVFSAISLIIATFIYLAFLWHYIPQRDARLSTYCRRKIDKRLEKIVESKIQAAIEEENRKREKAEKRAELKRQKTGELAPPTAPKLSRKPTLPLLEDQESKIDEQGGDLKLARQDTGSSVSTLPLYSSRPGTGQAPQRQPTLPNISEDESVRPLMPYRSATQGSTTSLDSNAPLLPNVGDAGGDGRIQSPAPTYYSRQDSNASQRPMPPRRLLTNGSQASQRPTGPFARMDSQMSMGNQSRANTLMARADSYQAYGNVRPPPGQRFPVRTNTGMSYDEPTSAVDFTASPQEMKPGRTAFGLDNAGPASQLTYSRSVTAPMSSVTPGAGSGPDTQTAYGNLHGRQGSFSRPFGRGAPPSNIAPAPGIERRPPYDSTISQQNSLSRSMPSRKPTPGNLILQRPTQPSNNQDQPTPQPGSFEMTTQPSYTSTKYPASTNNNASSTYTAFKPSLANANVTTPQQQIASTVKTPPTILALQDGPRRDVAVAITGGPGQGDSYFGRIEVASAASPSPPRQQDQHQYRAYQSQQQQQQRPQQQQGYRAFSPFQPSLPSNATAATMSPPPPQSAQNHRLTTGYNDILDAYGGATPVYEYDDHQNGSVGRADPRSRYDGSRWR